MCVYSGKETKMSLNSKITSVKFSTVERSLNRYIFTVTKPCKRNTLASVFFRFLVFFVGLLLTEMTVSTVVSMTLGFEYRREQDVEET